MIIHVWYSLVELLRFHKHIDFACVNEYVIVLKYLDTVVLLFAEPVEFILLPFCLNWLLLALAGIS